MSDIQDQIMRACEKLPQELASYHEVISKVITDAVCTPDQSKCHWIEKEKWEAIKDRLSELSKRVGALESSAKD